jgi:ribosomal protein L11 methylase PrmA
METSRKQSIAARAEKIATWITKHNEFRSHARHLSRDELESHGLVIERLEDDQNLQELVLSTFHATTQTFDGTQCAKIIENNLGKAFVKSIQQQLVVQQVGAKPAAPVVTPDNPQLQKAIRGTLKKH